MNRLQAIKHIRAGQTLVKIFEEDRYGIDGELVIWLRYMDICDFGRTKKQAHDNVGPIHCRFWEGGKPHWIHISPKQVLSFIKRNFSR